MLFQCFESILRLFLLQRIVKLYCNYSKMTVLMRINFHGQRRVWAKKRFFKVTIRVYVFLVPEYRVFVF